LNVVESPPVYSGLKNNAKTFENVRVIVRTTDEDRTRKKGRGLRNKLNGSG
jgi:hypothetical protein